MIETGGGERRNDRGKSSGLLMKGIFGSNVMLVPLKGGNSEGRVGLDRDDIRPGQKYSGSAIRASRAKLLYKAKKIGWRVRLGQIWPDFFRPINLQCTLTLISGGSS